MAPQYTWLLRNTFLEVHLAPLPPTAGGGASRRASSEPLPEVERILEFDYFDLKEMINMRAPGFAVPWGAPGQPKLKGLGSVSTPGVAEMPECENSGLYAPCKKPAWESTQLSQNWVDSLASVLLALGRRLGSQS